MHHRSGTSSEVSGKCTSGPLAAEQGADGGTTHARSIGRRRRRRRRAPAASSAPRECGVGQWSERASEPERRALCAPCEFVCDAERQSIVGARSACAAEPLAPWSRRRESSAAAAARRPKRRPTAALRATSRPTSRAAPVLCIASRTLFASRPPSTSESRALFYFYVYYIYA